MPCTFFWTQNALSPTSCQVLRRNVIPLFFDFADVLGLMPMGLPAHSGLLGSARWNGEDIFMSMVHHHCSGQPNYAIPSMPSVVEFESSDDHGSGGGGAAVGGNIAGSDALMWVHAAGLKTAVLHGVYRSVMWRIARTRLNTIARYTGYGNVDIIVGPFPTHLPATYHPTCAV